ncbi:methionine synthase [Desulfosporosinus nitroreducens]|uniref:Methionine synthase n=1 Tax=Desulfosporosinus nitroreducens TaxID=2018668 RepID=A0ABT8QKE3_9FIRM|nr:methionine synthase [Desulfosporosinus nitroreducens]MCO1601254.1 methionine synthase [Desulfosporosinus nitroreducens]MDO0821756.1 methionine synthase [Desulfosporosinus nitroreducens]
MKNEGFIPRFLTTGVGSVPQTNSEEALDLIWNSVPFAPHWPQLPNLGAESSFIGQYLNALIETGVIGDVTNPKFQIEETDWLERMTEFYSLYLQGIEGDEQALDRFGFSSQGGEGFEAFYRSLERSGTREAVILKGQLSGPLTLGMQITDKNRRSSYYDESLRDMLVKTLTLHAEWQTKRLRKFGLPVIMTVDDPGLYGFGASTHVTLNRENLIAELNSIFEGILRQGGIPGAHVCAGMDWTLLFDSKVVVVNFDAYDYMQSMMVLAEPINRFLMRGGVLSWGIVPTNPVAWKETAESLIIRLEDNIAELVKRGVDESLLRQQSMITPSCGTGTLQKELSEHIYGLLAEIQGGLV